MSTYYAGLLADIGILTLGALSVFVILATNQLSLGNAGFMAIGSYLSSFLTVEMQWPLTGAIVVAALAASIIGIVVGFPALRLKGIYLAIATLGFGEMVRSFFLVFTPMGGAGGYHGMHHVALGTIWIWTAGILLVILLLERSHVWLQMRAVHDDETAAGLVGLNTTLIKVGAFGLGAAIAAVAGALFAHHHVYIEPGNFGFERSIDFVLAVILGGSTVGIGVAGRRCGSRASARMAALHCRLAACCLRRAVDHRSAHAAPRPSRPPAVSAAEVPERQRHERAFARYAPSSRWGGQAIRRRPRLVGHIDDGRARPHRRRHRP